MSDEYTTIDGEGVAGRGKYGSRFVRYYVLRATVNLSTGLAYFVALYLFHPAGDVTAALSEMFAEPAWFVVASLALGSVLWIAVDAVVVGGVCGWLLLNDARAGIMPFWAMPRELENHV